MAEPPTWHSFRRTLAWAGIGFWVLIGLAPMIALVVQTARGDRSGAELARVLVTIGIPALLYTVGLFYAVQIYRAKTPDESRAPAWKLTAAFLGGYAFYLGASFVMNG